MAAYYTVLPDRYYNVEVVARKTFLSVPADSVRILAMP